MTKDIFQIIKKSKADFTQINFMNSITQSVFFEKRVLKDFSNINRNNVSISVWVGKKKGVISSNYFSEDLLKKAIKVAKVSEDLEFFGGLPFEKKFPVVKKLNFGDKTQEEVIESSKSLLVDTKEKEVLSEAEFGYSVFNRKVVNSLGLDLEEKGSLCEAELMYVIDDNKPISYEDSFSLRNIPSSSFINNFSKKTLFDTRELLKPKTVKNFPDVVVFEQKAFTKLLDAAFLSNFSGLNVLKSRSILKDYLDKKFFSDKLNISDSGILEGGIGSQSFDEEGFPCQKTELIQKGFIKNFLYDYNIGKQAGKSSTGNSSGAGVGFNNVLVEKGSGIELDDALVIRDVIGAHTSNDVSTDFSVKTNGTFLVKNGNKFPIDDVLISGKMFDVLKNVVCVGKEIKNVGNFYIPQIALKGISIAGL